jgi:porphobilinogen synthase
MKRKFPNTRLRRLRSNSPIRNLIRESTLSQNDLIQPIFLIDGDNRSQKIKSMPEITRMSIDLAVKEITSLKKLGLQGVALFPCIQSKYKDKKGSESFNPNGLMQKAIEKIKKSIKDIAIISDVALDPYTSHGQDGVLGKNKEILNDETVEVLIKQALSHANSGVDIVAPSDMMDGRIKSIRKELEKNKFVDTKILSYSAKYSSNYYGPFRDAVGSVKNLGKSNKDTYQMDYANSKDAMHEVEMDINEGADIVMVKPGLPYLDIVNKISENYKVPIFVYQVSGEYAMIKAAVKNNWLDEKKVVIESLQCMKRAGANAIITYYAKDVLKWMK